MTEKRKSRYYRIKRMLGSIVFVVCGVYVGILLLLYFAQNSIIFVPSRVVSYSPRDQGMEYEDLTLKTEDGVNINAWYIPAEGADYTILYCHGNAGNMGNRVFSARYYVDQKMNVLLFDYRGYGRSEGKPSEQGLYHDVEAAWRWLVDEKKIPPEKIIIYGRSLGGAIAAYIASKRNAAGVITVSAFSSVPDMGKHLYPFLPVSLVSKYRLPTKEYLKQAKMPKLIIHGIQDEMIPVKMGELNFEAASEPKEFVQVELMHNDDYENDPQFRLAVKKFVEKLKTSKTSKPDEKPE